MSTLKSGCYVYAKPHLATDIQQFLSEHSVTPYEASQFFGTVVYWAIMGSDTTTALKFTFPEVKILCI